MRDHTNCTNLNQGDETKAMKFLKLLLWRSEIDLGNIMDVYNATFGRTLQCDVEVRFERFTGRYL